jgi:shikimate dehydrogenase
MQQTHNLFGLIGFPLSHSFSKKYFSEKFTKEDIKDCSYDLFPIESIDLFPKLISEHPELRGLNVTIPYKEQVLPFLSERSIAVKEIGACNCIRIKGQELIGYNTDVLGFEKMIMPYLRPYHNNALILGTGGAAKAVAWVFNKLGIDYTYVSRKQNDTSVQYLSLNRAYLNKNAIIVNTTPIGMSPYVEDSPVIPYEFISDTHLCIDLIYNPAKTLFLAKAEARGATILNGLEMLIVQAEESWNIWNDL